MPDLLEHFEALTRVRPPETWPDPGELEPRFPRRGSVPGRRVGLVVLALMVAAAGLAFAVWAFRPGPGAAPASPGVRTVPLSPQPSRATRPTPAAALTTPAPAPSLVGGMFAAMLDAIRASSPPGWRFALAPDRLDGDWSLDGAVDDGSGPGRLYVDVTFRPGMIEADPCADSEFRQGSSCVVRQLPGGDRLVLRGVVEDPGGMRTIDVVLIHPDRSGVTAEAGNWTIAPLPTGTPISQSGLSVPKVTRAAPLYTVDQLAELVQAVDRAASRCTGPGCG